MGNPDTTTRTNMLTKDSRFAKLVAVLTMWMYCFTSVGLIKGLGIILPTLQVQFQTKTWVVGWMTSMIVAMGGIVSLFVGVLQRRFGAGYLMIVCGMMIGLAAIVGSFSVTLPLLAIAYVLLAGSGLGISSVICKEVLGRCFVENHATAVGIARTGSSIALFVCAPLVQLFLDTYGWRGTMLLMGGIFLNLTVCGTLMRKTDRSNYYTDDYREIPGDSSSARYPTNLLSCLCTTWKNFDVNFDLRLLLDVRFWTGAVIYCNGKFVVDMWRIYFVSCAVSKDFSLEDAATFVMVAGVGGLIGKIAQGFVVDRGILSSLNVMGLAIGVSTASYCATPWLASYWLVMTSALLIVIADAFRSCLADVFVKQLLGVELLASAYGWMGILSTILRLTLGFMPGMMYDSSGSYNAAFVFLGCVQASSFIALLIIRYEQLF